MRTCLSKVQYTQNDGAPWCTMVYHGLPGTRCTHIQYLGTHHGAADSRCLSKSSGLTDPRPSSCRESSLHHGILALASERSGTDDTNSAPKMNCVEFIWVASGHDVLKLMPYISRLRHTDPMNDCSNIFQCIQVRMAVYASPRLLVGCNQVMATESTPRICFSRGPCYTAVSGIDSRS